MSEEKKTTTKTDKKTVEIKPGMTVKVHEKIREKNSKGEEKERIQIFEGMVLAHKHNKEAGATITVRKVSGGIGVEKIFPLNSPIITKIEPLKQAEVRRAKLGYLRTSKKRLRETKLS
ncbi:50S ribosomal protein L19 [bacterium]|jgi:large subunit ribosomal protein L19|nr:50S ribosomal protein L19 [bacterium]